MKHKNSAQSTNAREAARKNDGKFGTQVGTEPIGSILAEPERVMASNLQQLLIQIDRELANPEPDEAWITQMAMHRDKLRASDNSERRQLEKEEQFDPEKGYTVFGERMLAVGREENAPLGLFSPGEDGSSETDVSHTKSHTKAAVIIRDTIRQNVDSIMNGSRHLFITRHSHGHDSAIRVQLMTDTTISLFPVTRDPVYGSWYQSKNGVAMSKYIFMDADYDDEFVRRLRMVSMRANRTMEDNQVNSLFEAPRTKQP